MMYVVEVIQSDGRIGQRSFDEAAQKKIRLSSQYVKMDFVPDRGYRFVIGNEVYVVIEPPEFLIEGEYVHELRVWVMKP